MNEEEYTRLRKEMVEHQLKGRGIHDSKVLEAFMKVRRHVFVPPENRDLSYEDYPLPVGYEQTISQPYIVAFMTEILTLNKNMRVLEIGTGSGYQAAILSCLCKEVYSVEIIPELGNRARDVLVNEGYTNVKVRIGDGYKGWIEYAPFDAIIVTCAPTEIPAPLTAQLKEGGKMIIPAGVYFDQKLYLVQKINGKIRQSESLPVRFVPMIH